MNILLVHNHYQIPGGEDSVVDNEKKLLTGQGCKVILYIRSNNEINRLPVYRKILLPLTSIFSIRTYREVRRLIREEQIDFVHVHNTLTLISPSVYYAAFRENKPVVQTIHNYRMICMSGLLYRNDIVCEECIYKGLHCGIRHKCYRGSLPQTIVNAAILYVHRILKTYQRINMVCLTEFNREKLLSAGRKGKTYFRKEKIFIKPNFVDIECTPISFNERRRQFVYAGRLDVTKGIRKLLNAWLDMKEEELFICGDGPEREWCIQFCEKNHMDHVHLMGQITHEEVMELIGQSFALIYPTQLYEGQPMTIIESFAVGTPVIGTMIGNTKELIKDGENGILIDIELKDLKPAVTRISSEMSENCYKEFQQKFTAQAAYRNFVEIWGKIDATK